MKFLKLAALGLTLISSQAFAASKKCEIEMVAKCICQRSMYVTCDNGEKGFIDNAVKPLSVTITVEGDNRSFEVKQPKRGVREYYTPAAIPEVLKMLNDAGIEGTEDDLWTIARMKSFQIDTSVKLFDQISE